MILVSVAATPHKKMKAMESLGVGWVIRSVPRTHCLLA